MNFIQDFSLGIKRLYHYNYLNVNGIVVQSGEMFPKITESE